MGCSCGHLREKDFIATKVPTAIHAEDIELVTPTLPHSCLHLAPPPRARSSA